MVTAQFKEFNSFVLLYWVLKFMKVLVTTEDNFFNGISISVCIVSVTRRRIFFH
jgi:hypothetical protein